MGHTLEPAAALEPETLTSVYLGALGLEDPDRRLAAAQTVLCLGRLGLRPEELLHLHAGWIDWEHGDVAVPAHEDCACELCWERARVAQRDGDGRPLAAIVAEDRWSGTPRTIPFGWAERLTGVLATAIETWDHLEFSAEDLRELVGESAERAAGVDPEAVDFGALRAAAAAFFADAGFDAPRVADVMGIDVETAAAFTAQEPGRARTHLYQAFDAEPPATAGQGETYPLLTDPSPLENEPFDPTDFDAAWRADRAADDGGAETDDGTPPDDGNPRPAIVPEDVTVPPDEAASRTTRGAESGDRRGTANEQSTEPVDRSTEIQDPRDLVSPPVVYSASTRFAGSSLLSGRPAGGQVVFGGAEFALGAHGGGELQATLVASYDAVRDVAIDWAPDHIAEIFEGTVGIAVEREGGDRETLVIEIPEGERESLVRTLFEAVLGEVSALVRHPATIKNQVTDAEPARRRVAVAHGRIDVGPTADEPDPSIAMADVIGIDRESLTLDGQVYHGVVIQHIQRDGKRIGTFVAPRDDRARRLLERYVRADLDHRRNRAAAADLTSDEYDVLDALETNPGRRDLAKLLGMDHDTLAAVLESLASSGFVHAAEDGVRISGMGRLHLGEAAPDVDA